MGTRGASLRRWARGVGVTLTVVAMAAATVVAAPSPASSQDVPPGMLPEGDWTEDQVATLLDMIDEAETVLPDRFPARGSSEEITAELASMGFGDIGAVAPGGYWHFINGGWIGDEHVFNPEYAESLVYRGPRGGELELVAAMYFYPVGSVADVPEEHAWIPGWHTHPELCFSGGRLAGIIDPATEECPEGTAPATGPPMIHVWITDNECGHRFGGVGVTGIHCEEHDHGDDDEHDDGHGDDHGDDHDDGHDDHDDGHGDGDDGHDDNGDGGHGHDDGDDHDDEHDGDHDHDGAAPPAPGIVGTPDYTG